VRRAVRPREDPLRDQMGTPVGGHIAQADDPRGQPDSIGFRGKITSY
jgi:hypothetical protein